MPMEMEMANTSSSGYYWLFESKHKYKYKFKCLVQSHKPGQQASGPNLSLSRHSGNSRSS